MKLISLSVFIMIQRRPPAWGRGLKYRRGADEPTRCRRPRTGAWIEMIASRSGIRWSMVAPARGAWIEIPACLANLASTAVAPARGRGLKFLAELLSGLAIGSPPHGGVD